jgi:hypothetical protein
MKTYEARTPDTSTVIIIWENRSVSETGTHLNIGVLHSVRLKSHVASVRPIMNELNKMCI